MTPPQPGEPMVPLRRAEGRVADAYQQGWHEACNPDDRADGPPDAIRYLRAAAVPWPALREAAQGTPPQPGEPMVPLSVALDLVPASASRLLALEEAAVPWPAAPAATPDRVSVSETYRPAPGPTLFVPTIGAYARDVRWLLTRFPRLLLLIVRERFRG